MGWFWDPGSWLSRLVFTRALAVIYAVAFLVALNQFRALIGQHGLLPVPRYVTRIGFRRAPSLFHYHYSDRFFAACAWLGAAMSAAAVAGLADRLPLGGWMLWWTVLWALYLSIVNVGQIWYGFGWESLLIETGFLAIFLGPAGMAPPRLVMWLLRWLLFRLEFGAGLIKIRGDQCWRDLTCLYYHHETQPMPNPLSWYFHHLPERLHRVEVLANHATQLVVVFGLFAPQPVATVAAAIIIVTQAWLMISGNFSWLNALTLAIALSVVGGPALHHLLPIGPGRQLATPDWYVGVAVVLAAAVAVMSWWPVRNMLSSRQQMNASFNSLHLVNTYGAFGSITRVRTEVVIEGTDDPAPGPETEWREYQFKGKPGDPGRRPRQFAPYHLRLDWLMWFAGINPAYADTWLGPLLRKLLDGDRTTLRLLGANPFPETPPRFVRARLFRYRFTTPEERRATGDWWVRSPAGYLVRPISVGQLSG